MRLSPLVHKLFKSKLELWLSHSLGLDAESRVFWVVNGDEERRVILDRYGEAAVVEKILLDHVAPLRLALRGNEVRINSVPNVPMMRKLYDASIFRNCMLSCVP